MNFNFVPNQYAVGDEVTGVDCGGRRFSGSVEDATAYSVKVNNKWTSVSMIESADDDSWLEGEPENEFDFG